MPLYTTVKGINNANIYDNVTQDITGLRHNTVNEEIIDHVGAAQVYGFPATTDNPGTPQNPRAYFALPGTYTNFGGLTITAPLGILIWDGDNWTAKQLAMPSGYNYFRAVTTQARSAGSTYTTLTITQATPVNNVGGGWNAFAGEWVQLVNRRTGQFDFVQLTADLEDDDTSITFKSRKFAYDMPIGSIVECYPVLNMVWKTAIPVSSGGFNYVDVDSDWPMPPVECDTPVTYMRLLRVRKNRLPCGWVSGESPAELHEYAIHGTTRTRIIFNETLEAGSVVEVEYLQPIIYETYISS